MILLIFSDVFAPTVLTAPLVRFLIYMNPFFILKVVLTDYLILNKPLESLYPNFIKQGILLLIVMIIAYLSKKVSKEEVIQ